MYLYYLDRIINWCHLFSSPVIPDSGDCDLTAFSLVLTYDKKLIQTVNNGLREDVGFKKFDNDRKDWNSHLRQLLAMSITAKVLRLSISLKKVHSCMDYNHRFTFLTAIK